MPLSSASGCSGAAIAMMFAVGGLAFVVSERQAGTIIAVDVPVWVAALAFPVAFTLIAARLAWKSSPHWWGRAISAAGLVAGAYAARHFEIFEGAALLLSGLVPVLSTVPGIFRFFESLTRSSDIFFPFAVMVPTLVGVFLQMADARNKDSGMTQA